MELITHIASFVVGAGAGFTLKVVLDMRRTKTTTTTTQSGNWAGGSIAGRDINNNSNKPDAK